MRILDQNKIRPQERRCLEATFNTGIAKQVMIKQQVLKSLLFNLQIIYGTVPK